MWWFWYHKWKLFQITFCPHVSIRGNSGGSEIHRQMMEASIREKKYYFCITILTTMASWIKTHVPNPAIKCILIKESSGPRVTATKLQVGHSYLYRELYKYRTIIQIDDTTGHIGYREQADYWYPIIGSCSSAYFVQACPHEATMEEKEFIDSGEQRIK